MERKVLSFSQFLNEQETGTTGATGSSDSENLGRPETEREAKSRIAKGIVQSVFGDIGGSGGVDSYIEQTKEVKESLPYKGCGISDPYKLEKTPLSVMTIKLLLNYLQEKKVGDYTRVINELNEKRAVIIGIRNRIATKKESANQDRFCDALYYIPGNAKDGTESAGATGATGASSGFMQQKKNESLSLRDYIEQRVTELETVSESGLWTFEDFAQMNNEREFLIKNRYLLEAGEISENDFVELYEDFLGIGGFLKGAWDKGKQAVNWVGKKIGLVDDKPKGRKVDMDSEDDTKSSSQKQSGAAGATGATGATGPTPPSDLGDKIEPYQITTVASLAYYGKKPMNPKGVGIKLPGDTLYVLQESILGGKTKYKMMVEAEKIKVGRYPIGVTKYETYKPAETYTESCGMQIHRSSTKGVGVCIGPWSAGCQVFSDYAEWQEFISKAEKETMNSSKFLYGLIQLDDIPEEVLKSAIIGLPYSPQQEQQPVAQNVTGGTQVKGSGKDVRSVGFSED